MEAQTAIPCPDRNFRILTETNADMAMLRSGGDLEVTGFLTIDHVTFHPSRTTPCTYRKERDVRLVVKDTGRIS